MQDSREISEEILGSLQKNDALRRKHASFWNFHKKSSKELGLFSQFFERFEQECGEKVQEWNLSDKDPPDVYARLCDGKLKGIEITELVNEQAIHNQINDPRRFSEELFRFDFQEAIQKLREVLMDKEDKARLKRVGEDYDGISLLIHTDEPLLKSDQFLGLGRDIYPDGSEVFEGVYLLFSYEPDRQECPILRLV